MDSIDAFKLAADAFMDCNAAIQRNGYPDGVAEHWMRSAMKEVAEFISHCMERYDGLGDEQWFREIVDIVDAQQAQETANEEHAMEFTAQELDAIEAGGRQAMLLKKLLSSIEPGTKHWANDPDRIDAATYAIAAAAEERKQLIYKLYAVLLTSTKGETPEYLASRAVLAADIIIKKI